MPDFPRLTCGVDPPEEWRTLPFNSFYDVSSLGRVRSWKCYGRHAGARRKRARILRPLIKRGGYLGVRISDEEGVRDFFIHVLVALLFIGEPVEGRVVNHRDFNKANNVPLNLEYVTRKENEEHAYAGGHKLNTLQARKQCSDLATGRRLTEADVLNMRKMRGTGITYNALALHFKISTEHARRCCTGERWRWTTLR